MYPGELENTTTSEKVSEVEESPEERARKLELERMRKLKQEAKETRLTEEWESFLEREFRELELRKNGQLSQFLGEPLPGEPTEVLQKLARQDQEQAKQGLLTLMIGEKTTYKHIDDLTREDMPARIAANSLRTNWLKERRDGWLADGGRNSNSV
ncbi:MAG: hypothetical protein ACR2KW_00785 [Rubrobacter sp.]